MNQDEQKVKFSNKEMNLLEAKLYLCGLRGGIIKANLNEEEKESYKIWKYIREERNNISNKLIGKSLFKKINEEKYLIEKLNNEIRLTKIAKKRFYCEKNGHKERKGSSYTASGVDGIRTSAHCLRCGAIYERKPTQEELENLNSTPYNQLII